MILVFGKTGQVARELQALAPATTPVTALGRDHTDLSHPETCAQAIQDAQPKVVINAAAYTAVDQAEDHEDLATRINADAPTVMAQTCAALNIPLVHISTDYVFDGQGTDAFAPDHPTAPLGAYGRSKCAGEIGIKDSKATHVILRTSWVFSTHGSNFLKTMLRLGRERDELNVVADQIGGPTAAHDIAMACLRIAEALQHDPSLAGTYHFSGSPDVSWADFARSIFRAANLNCTVNDIPSTAYPTPARRPANSRLDCSTLSRFGLARPEWHPAMMAVLKDLEALS